MNPAARLVASVLIVAATPPLAWLLWVGSGDGPAGDAAHVGWFVSVAVGVVVAGLLAPRRSVDLGVLWVVAVTSTMTTLFLWWSSEDDSGLFVIGVALALPLVVAAAPALLLLGRAISRTRSVRNVS